MPAASPTEPVADTSLDEIDIGLAIDELLDAPVPDPVVAERRREQLRAAASRCAEATVEVLVHNKMSLARGVAPRPDDAPVVAMARALGALHQALCRYHHPTVCRDGWEVAQVSMEAVVGAGAAAIGMRLLRQLREDLSTEMRERWP